MTTSAPTSVVRTARTPRSQSPTSSSTTRGSRSKPDTVDLAAYSNDQVNRIFSDSSPVNGYVDVWSDTAGAAFTCYGSVVDNVTGDPTTILPQ